MTRKKTNSQDDNWFLSCAAFITDIGEDVFSLGKLIKRKKHSKVETCAASIRTSCDTALLNNRAFSISEGMYPAREEYELIIDSILKIADEAQAGMTEMKNGERASGMAHISNVNTLMGSLDTHLCSFDKIVRQQR